jgi:hypothetical protein
MNTDRLLREVERRLVGLDESHRNEVLDAIREEIARERRRVDPSLTVEAERERRVEAEILREVLEAINRQAHLDETIDEVLKQLARLAAFDSCWVALLETEGRLRIISVRGFPEPGKVLGTTYREALADAIVESRMPLSLPDAQADERFTGVPGGPPVRSWLGLPLLMEGEVVGVLCLGRDQVDPFLDEDLHRARAVAFSAAAAIRKAQLLGQVRRYAALLEQVVAVDQTVFNGADARSVARVILQGAARVGNYRAGMFVQAGPKGPVVLVAMGDACAGTEGRAAPGDLAATATRRLPPSRVLEMGEALGVTLPAQEMYLVPLSTSEIHVGALALLDPDGESPDDRLMESYALRAATAYLHVARAKG